MQAGKLRHLIQFERKTEEQDSDGALVETWSPAYGGRRFWANVDDLSGRELLAAAAINAKVTTRIIVRAMPNLDAKMRVVFQGRNYNIDAIIRDPNSRNQHFTLACYVGTNEG